MEIREIIYYIALSLFIVITVLNIINYYRGKFDEDWKKKYMKDEENNS